MKQKIPSKSENYKREKKHLEEIDPQSTRPSCRDNESLSFYLLEILLAMQHLPHSMGPFLNEKYKYIKKYKKIYTHIYIYIERKYKQFM